MQSGGCWLFIQFCCGDFDLHLEKILPDRTRLIRVAATAWGLGFLLLTLETFIFRNSDFHKTIMDIAYLVVETLTVLSMLAAAFVLRKQSSRLAWAWLLMGLGVFAFSLGDLAWAYLEETLKQIPFPSIADAGYLLLYPFFFSGLVLYTWKRFAFLTLVKDALDISIVFVTSTLGFWIFLISPLYEAGSAASVLEQIILTLYPVCDLVLVFSLFVLILNGANPENLVPAWTLGVALLVLTVTDTIYSIHSMLGTYTSSGLLDLGWILSFGLISMAAIQQINFVINHPEKLSARIFDQNWFMKARRSIAYMPYIWVLVAYWLLFQHHDNVLSLSPNFFFLMVGAVISFVILRQTLVMWENAQLLEALQKSLIQINNQAGELAKTNEGLRNEIALRSEIEERLSHDSLHDLLTGLSNRMLFMNLLTHAFELTQQDGSTHYSLFFLNLDNFKSVNNTLGHKAGDLILMEIGDRLIKCIKPVDTVARFEGDEFVFLLENTSERIEVLQVQDRIQKEMEKPIKAQGKVVHLSASIGIVQNFNIYSDPEEIIRDAQIAMQNAKTKGKGKFEVFQLEMRTSLLSRIEIEKDLARAIQSDELYLNFQPIFSLDQNRIDGLEALIRWNHPKRGLVMPAEFIPIAEETGLIFPLGDWVLEAACRQLVRWLDMFKPLDYLFVCVNISGKEIEKPDFVQKIKAVLTRTGLSPSNLKLEITETAFVQNQVLVDEKISELRKDGVLFMLDDFGTGYTSFSYLKNFSPSTIKIDKTFIKDIAKDGKAYEIVRTIIAMAQEMGIDVLAEGIENASQLAILKELKCNQGQGFLLAKPLKTPSAENILRGQSLIATYTYG